MDAVLHLSLVNSVSEINSLADALARFGEEHEIAPAALTAANLALEEIVMNVISYGYADGAEHRIDVYLQKRPGELAMRVEDDGRPFDPLQRPEPEKVESIEDAPIGGLGIHLVRSMMDTVAYRRDGNRNVLTMTKRL